MFKKKLIISLAAVLMLAGCGDKKVDHTPDPGPTPTPEVKLKNYTLAIDFAEEIPEYAKVLIFGSFDNWDMPSLDKTEQENKDAIAKAEMYPILSRKHYELTFEELKVDTYECRVFVEYATSTVSLDWNYIDQTKENYSFTVSKDDGDDYTKDLFDVPATFVIDSPATVVAIQATLKDSDKTFHVGDVIDADDIEVVATYEDSSSGKVNQWECDYFYGGLHTLTDEDCADRVETIDIVYRDLNTSINIDVFDGRVTLAEWNAVINYVDNADNHKVVIKKRTTTDFVNEEPLCDFYVDGSSIKREMGGYSTYYTRCGCLFAEIKEVNEAYSITDLTTNNNSEGLLPYETKYLFGEAVEDTRDFDTTARAYYMEDGQGLGFEATFDYVNKTIIPVVFAVEAFADNFIISRFSEYGTYELSVPEVNNIVADPYDEPIPGSGTSYSWTYCSEKVVFSNSIESNMLLDFQVYADVDDFWEGEYFNGARVYKNGVSLYEGTDYSSISNIEILISVSAGDQLDILFDFTYLNPAYKTGNFSFIAHNF